MVIEKEKRKEIGMGRERVMWKEKKLKQMEKEMAWK